MKNLQSVLFVLCSCLIQLHSQPDLQWLILDSKGKMSAEVINGELVNKYPGPQMSEDKFTLNGVMHPNRSSFPKSKNNLFILYENGTHFNSRESINTSLPYYTNDFFFQEATNTSSPLHRFSKSTPSRIECMYLTNIYEEDDPPIGLSVESGWYDTPTTSGTYKLGITDPQVPISATHDITRRKDVTLILSKEELIQAGIDTTEEFTLSYNEIVNKSNGTNYLGTFFEPSYIFKHDLNPVSFYYPFDPSNNLTSSGPAQRFKFKNSDYIYVNLRPQRNLEMYYPQTVDGEPTHEAKFTIRQGTIRVTHTEDLVSAHDPNFVQLCKLIRTRENKTFLKYRVQFENASMQPASNLAVEFTFDDRYYLNTTKLKKIKAGQNTHRFRQNGPPLPKPIRSSSLCTLENNGRTATVHFPAGWQVAAGGRRGLAIGYVDFLVQVDSGIRWERGEIPTMPMECKVFFNDIPFYVDIFKDIKLKKSNNQSDPADEFRPAYRNASEYNASLPGCISNPESE